jgi:protein phosphatase
MQIRNYAATEQMDRPNNEDFYYADEKNRLYIVADGMGGTEGGEIASKFAALLAKKIVAILGSLSKKDADETISPDEKMLVYDYEKVLRHAFFEAHERTRKEGAKQSLEDMGCTIVLLLFREDRVFIMNAGDCRCYLYNEGKLKQITRDHSPVARKLREGKITPEEAQMSRSGSVSRWIGGHKFSGGADTYMMPYYINDRFIICTDGVSKILTYEDIESAAKKDDIKEGVSSIIKAVKDSKEKRAKDNATVMIVEVAEVSASGEKTNIFEKTARIRIPDDIDDDDDMDD